MFLRNVCLSPNYTALQPTRLYSPTVTEVKTSNTTLSLKLSSETSASLRTTHRYNPQDCTPHSYRGENLKYNTVPEVNYAPSREDVWGSNV
jgi:hypothetical protein